jgi:hypothetical protein
MGTLGLANVPLTRSGERSVNGLKSLGITVALNAISSAASYKESSTQIGRLQAFMAREL